jgi:hypothetical protein
MCYEMYEDASLDHEQKDTRNTSFTRTQSSHHPIPRSKRYVDVGRRGSPKPNTFRTHTVAQKGSNKVHSPEELLIFESLPCRLVGFGSTRFLTVSASILVVDRLANF